MLLASNILNDADRNAFGIEGASIYSAQIVVFFTLFPFREWKNFLRCDKKPLNNCIVFTKFKHSKVYSVQNLSLRVSYI